MPINFMKIAFAFTSKMILLFLLLLFLLRENFNNIALFNSEKIILLQNYVQLHMNRNLTITQIKSNINAS